MYRLICMSFDGEYKVERGPFDTINDAWKHSGEIGSRWYFYPFHFVVTKSLKTVVNAPFPMQHLTGMRVKTVASIFEETSKRPELRSAGVEEFSLAV